MKAIFVCLGCLSVPSSAWSAQAGALSLFPPGPAVALSLRAVSLSPFPPQGRVPVPRGCVRVPRRQPRPGCGSAWEGRLLPGRRLGPARCGAARRSEGGSCSRGTGSPRWGRAVPLSVARAFGVGRRTCLALKLCLQSQPLFSCCK